MPRLATLSPSTPAHDSTGGTLVTSDGRALPLRQAALRGRLRAGLGAVALEQTFVNPHAEPLRVTYQLPLPEDGAVSGFSFRIGDRIVRGEVDRKHKARERFEQAISQGHTAALLEQDRTSLFTQELGNVPPGATITARIEIDQRLTWLDDLGGWEFRFPTVVAPRYQGGPGRVPDAAKVHVHATATPRPIDMSLALTIADALPEGAPAPSSPSHALALGRDGAVTLAEKTAGLDRDVVVRWPVATPQVGMSVDVARPEDSHPGHDHAYGLVTLVPPSIPTAPVKRDLVVLLDTSGSMHGEPLAQATRLASALVDALGPDDTFELIEFSNQARRYAKKPRTADASAKRDALQWIAGLRAGGGTEMVTGIIAALEGVRPEAQRQVVVITDGLIGFENEVLSAVMQRLPTASRVHTVGVGSAVNRSLTGPVARVGRGTEVVIGFGEDPEPAVARLLARTAAPIVVDVALEGAAIAQDGPRVPDLFAAAPASVPVRLSAQGGSLTVRGRTVDGPWAQTFDIPAQPVGRGSMAVVSRWARERVEDLEVEHTAGGDRAALDECIATIGIEFSIATRLTSWLAVSDEQDVDPGEPSRREHVPQEIPHGMSAEGLGLRASAPIAVFGMPAGPPAAAPMMAPAQAKRRRSLLGALGAAAGGIANAVGRASKGAFIGGGGDAGSGGAPRAPEGPAGPPMPPASAAPPPQGRAPEPADEDQRYVTQSGYAPAPGDADGFADEDDAAESLVLDEEAPLEEAQAEADALEGAKAKPSPGRVVTGRLVARGPDRWVIELIVEGEPLAWPAISGAVTITFADEGTRRALVESGTTRPGTYPAGTTLRLALRPTGDDGRAVARVVLGRGADSVTIQLVA